MITGTNEKHVQTSFFLANQPALPSDTISQQNELLSHYSLKVRQLLGEKLPDFKIKKRVPVPWPPAPRI